MAPLSFGGGGLLYGTLALLAGVWLFFSFFSFCFLLSSFVFCLFVFFPFFLLLPGVWRLESGLLAQFCRFIPRFLLFCQPPFRKMSAASFTFGQSLWTAWEASTLPTTLSNGHAMSIQPDSRAELCGGLLRLVGSVAGSCSALAFPI